MDDLAEFFDTLAQASWPEPLWHAARDFFLKQGVDRLSYHHLPPLGAPDEGKIRVVAEGFPEDWLHDYIRKKKFRYDPIVAHATVTEFPFRWSEIRNIRDLSAVEEELVGEFEDAGLGDGYAVPVLGPGGRNGYFGLGHDGPPHSLADVRKYHWACQHAHLLYCKMLSATQPESPKLSEREMEILRWVATGKSNGVIADIMGLSPHTIDAHVRRIFLKLGTTDRISATIRGLGMKLIRSY